MTTQIESTINSYNCMSKSYIPKVLRQKVADQAQHRCGYCLTAEDKARNGMSYRTFIAGNVGRLNRGRKFVVGLCRLQ